MALTVSGDTIHLNNTTAASTVTLIGADLTAFPSGTYGTVAQLVTAGVTSVTDSGGNFTLNASGNHAATTFNFGTGVISGADPASSAGITYSGVTTYITSTDGDTVTLSAATQNVTASNDTNTVNLGNLAYTGTLNLTAGSGGTDTINATVGGNLSGAAISGTAGHAHLALVLNAGGTETLSVAEYNLITHTTAGSITFTGGTAGTNHITFSNGGVVTTDIASVDNYTLSAAGNTITLHNTTDVITGDINSGNDTINLGSLAFAGTLAFGSGGTDLVNVNIGSDISLASITSSGATVELVLSGPTGTETLSALEYNLFNASAAGISGGGISGTNTVILTTPAAITDSPDVKNYVFQGATNTLTMTNNANDNVTGGSGVDTLKINGASYTGTSNLEAGANLLDVTHAGATNLSTAAVTATGGTVGLIFDNAGAQNITLTAAEYNGYATITDGLGVASTSTITLTTLESGTLNAAAGTYVLGNFGNSVTLGAASQSITGGAAGDTVNFGSLTATGTITLGSGANIVQVNAADIHGVTYSDAGTAALQITSAGINNETMTAAEYNDFNTTGITLTGGATAAQTTITLTTASALLTDSATVQNYVLADGANTFATTGNSNDNVTGGASGVDLIQVQTNGNDDGLVVSSSGATLELSITGVAAGSPPDGSSFTTETYNQFTTGPHAGGIVFGAGDTNPADYIVAFHDNGTVTDSATVGVYYFQAAGPYTFTIANNAADQIYEQAPGVGNTYNIDVATFTGTLNFGGGSSDTVNATVGGDISGATINSNATAATLDVIGSGTETISAAELSLFSASGIAFNAGSNNTLILNPGTNSPVTIVDSDLAYLSHVQNIQIDTSGSGVQEITLGSNFDAQGVTSLTTTSSTGNITIDASVTTGGATFAASSSAGGIIDITTGTGSSSVTASSTAAVTITSLSTTGDTLLSGTSSVNAALVINANGLATTGTYNITANAAGGTETINVSGGTGTEVYNITLGSHSGVATINTSEIGTGTQPNTVITGAQAGDIIQIFDTSATTFSSLGAESDVNTGINAAHTSFPGPGNVQTFTVGSNTYLVEDVASNTPAATSTVIELVGIHTISSVSSGAVTLAS